MCLESLLRPTKADVDQRGYSIVSVLVDFDAKPDSLDKEADVKDGRHHLDNSVDSLCNR